jgi:hypothetical protein
MLLSLCSLPSAGQSQLPQLGSPPDPPTDVSILPTAGPRPKSLSGGFVINPASREATRDFFNAVYTASDGVPIASTAITASCFPGTNAPAFADAVLRRINWFRAMAGMPASESFNAVNSAHDQAAALMMSANNTLNHFPPSSWACFSANGANAASNSNLSLGAYGADAITGFIQDFGAGNEPVGHRRWLLYPQTQVMGTGDVPPQGAYMGANATWVLDGNYGGTRPATRDPYVCWPPRGFVPYQVVFPRWSFAYPQADFSHATVTMTSNGVPVSLFLEVYHPNSYGENTLVWVPMGLNQDDGSTVWPFSGADTVYSVTINNVVGASATSYTYSVTAFDPAVPGSDYLAPAINGASQIVVGVPSAYSFTPITNATSYQWLQSTLSTFNFFDGAENGLTNFAVSVSPGYPVITNLVVASGAESFHLATPSPGDQILTLTHVVYPAANTALNFKSLLGIASPNQVARVQLSADSGQSWTDLYAQPGDNTWGQSSFTNLSISLGTYTGQSVLLRFDYSYLSPGIYYPTVDSGYPGYYAGWYLDNIVVTNSQELLAPVTNSIPSTNFTFTAAQAGNYALQARALIFTNFSLGWGPIKPVTATASSVPMVRLSKPTLSGSQLRLDFSLLSGSPSGFQLYRGADPTAAWSVDTGAVLTTNVPGSSYRFTTTTNSTRQYYRVRLL